MKIKTTLLPLFTACFSITGIIVRFWMNTAGTDSEGLIRHGHPSVAISFIILALTIGLLGLCALLMDKTPKTFAASRPGAIGCYIGALGLLVTTITEVGAMSASVQTSLSQLAGILSILFGFGSVAVFVLMGNCRNRGKSLNIWLYTVIVAFFVFHLLQQYQVWTQQPQLSDYMFPLLASVFLMLSVYHRACKDLGQSSEWQYLFFTQAALFCSLMSIFGKNWLFYGTMAAWTLLDSLPGKEQK